MCLLLVAYGQHADYRLIVAANRDEFYDRPAAAADPWKDHSHILGGRDLQGGGVWLAVNRAGAFGAITNIGMPARGTAVRSRGLIVSDYLTGTLTASAFVNVLAGSRNDYEGFNVLVSDATSLAWYSNQMEKPEMLPPEIYGLSNHLLDTPSPKVARVKADYLDARSLSEGELIDALFGSLGNSERAPDKDLPDPGVDLEFGPILAPIFITGDTYGTRCSTIVLVSYAGELTFIERRFGPGKAFLGESSFKFELAPGPT